jgi:hypothetical protein
MTNRLTFQSQETLRFGRSADDAWERHGASEIEHLFDLHLGGVNSEANEKWPLGYTVAFVLGSSLVLWAAIIFGVSRIF